MDNGHVLVVDDQPFVPRFMEMVLQDAGFLVTTTTDPYDAVTLAGSGRFFLTFTDIAMPGLDGYQVISHIRRVSPHTLFVAMTGFSYDGKHALVAIRKEYGCRFVFKPFSRSALLAVTREVQEECRLQVPKGVTPRRARHSG